MELLKFILLLYDAWEFLNIYWIKRFVHFISHILFTMHHYRTDCRDKGMWEWEYGGEPYVIDGIDEVHIVAIVLLISYVGILKHLKC